MSDILPTKSNLIKLKKTITLSKQGQELLEKKKYILIKEKEKYYSKKKKIEENFNEQYYADYYEAGQYVVFLHEIGYIDNHLGQRGHSRVAF